MGWRVTSGAVCLQAVEVIQELRRKESQLKRKKRRLRRRRDEYLWSVAPSAGERQKDSGGSCDPDSGLVIERQHRAGDETERCHVHAGIIELRGRDQDVLYSQSCED